MNMVDKIVLIPICCVCDRVRDDQQTSERPTSNGLEQWMSLRSFLRLYRLDRDAYKLTHTYCPRCMRHLGFDRPRSGEGLGQPRVETLQEDIRRRIVSAIGPASECDLDTLVARCGYFSWNQVFLEVDHLSRIGVIRLTRSTDGRYRVGSPTLAVPNGTQVPGDH